MTFNYFRAVFLNIKPLPTDMTNSALQIYALPTKYFFVASTRTEAGFAIASEPAGQIPASVDDLELGQVLLAALLKCRNTTPLPTPKREDYKSLEQKVLTRSGYKSWGPIHRKGQLVTIEFADDKLRLEPTRNGGMRGDGKGFEPIAEQSRFVSDNDAKLLGSKFREVLALCE